MNKILFLTGIIPPDIGGPIAQVIPLAEELNRRGYQVSVLTYGKEKNSYSFPVKKISGPFKQLRYILKGFFWSFRFDIVYSWDLYSAGLTGLLIKKFLGKKVVNRFAGDSAWEKAASRGLKDDLLTFQKTRYSLRIGFWKRMRKLMLVNSDKVIAVSNFMKQIALKIGVPDEKIVVIYNSVDIAEAAEGKRSDEIILLTSARLTPWKGVDMLIEIMASLEGKLVVIGDGPEMGRLKSLVEKLHLDGRVVFKGRISRVESAACMQEATLFLLNTRYEGLSHTILEAMKNGLPVITTPVGGNPETIVDKETGILVNYGVKKEWIEAINLLLKNPDMAQQMADRAKESLKKFNWNSLVAKTINVFEEICQKSY